jgi:hypothetical protein
MASCSAGLITLALILSATGAAACRVENPFAALQVMPRSPTSDPDRRLLAPFPPLPLVLVIRGNRGYARYSRGVSRGSHRAAASLRPARVHQPSSWTVRRPLRGSNPLREPLTITGEYDYLGRLRRDVHRDPATSVVVERLGDELFRHRVGARRCRQYFGSAPPPGWSSMVRLLASRVGRCSRASLLPRPSAPVGPRLSHSLNLRPFPQHPHSYSRRSLANLCCLHDTSATWKLHRPSEPGQPQS